MSAGPRGTIYRAAATAPSLDAFYGRLQQAFTTRVNPDYERLVVPNGNATEPIHRWFRLKEAFSRKLVERVIKDTRLDGATSITILDPFVGSGTTAVSAAELLFSSTLARVHVTGYECNPFLHLVARSKLRALQSPPVDFLAIATHIASDVLHGTVAPAQLPSLSTFQNSDFFSPPRLNALLRIRAAIDEVAATGADKVAIDLCRLCLGASIEPSSSLRRDGRALRYVPGKDVAEPVSEFLRRAEDIHDDLPSTRQPIRGQVWLGDGRRLTPHAPNDDTVDLVLFSPPYPNNIDYTEVYKLEAWLLGYITSSEAFANQRLRTVYSHPSLLRTEYSTQTTHPVVGELMATLAEHLPQDRYRVSREAMLDGYLRDMLQTLMSCRRAVKPSGFVVYVVGNSVHGTREHPVLVAADLLLARLAEAAGLEVVSIEVARALTRRGIQSEFLRESVVFLRRRPDV